MASVAQQVNVRPQLNTRPQTASRTAFAHPSEAEFASLLSYYGIAWLYEPTTFPLARDAEGNVSFAFAPDFYLPEYDLYIELATRKQSQMTVKNRKVRRLQELYPEVHLKLVNRRAFEGLLFKFGLEGRAGQLVGDVGHA